MAWELGLATCETVGGRVGSILHVVKVVAFILGEYEHAEKLAALGAANRTFFGTGGGICRFSSVGTGGKTSGRSGAAGAICQTRR
jgi:hypothetical protein